MSQTTLEPAATASEAPAAPRRPHWTAVVETLLIVAGLARLVWGQQVAVVADGVDRLNSISVLLTDGRLNNSEYSIMGPLFSTPLWLLGKAVATPEAGIKYFNLVVFTIGLAALWLLLRGLVPGALIRRFMLITVAASMLPPDVGHYGSETFTMMGVMVGIVVVVRGRRRGWGWAAAVVGVVNTPATVVGFGVVGLAETWRHRRLRLLVPVAVAAALILLEILARKGGYVGDRGSKDVMPFSGRPGFSYPFFFGVLAILFAFGRGIVWYLPGMFLPMRRALADLDGPAGIDLARIHRLWLLFIGGLVVVYAPWWAWYAGMSWGPRFFLAGILPAALVLALRLGHRQAGLGANLLTLAVLLLSVWIGLNSLFWHELWPTACFNTPQSVEALCWYSPEYSSLWYPLVSWQFAHLTATQWISVAYSAAVLAWLGTPLLRRIAAQLAAAWRDHLAPRLTRAAWRW
ncbi:hypothetical protein CS0771_74950 [Catellatospora sp. IY07-71]|uniref:hypothetical protein n=1 Tax=Catellatospora sp. IY07-71 TaxID=2728827 RepID=UPI001BB41C0C|nr:hypothetical protein [Catellatospora sp. IY07-71]BCJ77951.1 hypothetical protein CS0771_74950 [Catellatospora sp. IY07-71]